MTVNTLCIILYMPKNLVHRFIDLTIFINMVFIKILQTKMAINAYCAILNYFIYLTCFFFQIKYSAASLSNYIIDNYAKDGGAEEVWLLCSCYHESLRTWIKTIVNKFAISSHTALILGVRALRSYLKLICEYELHSLPNKKVSSAKGHGRSYIKVRPPLVRHLLRNRLFPDPFNLEKLYFIPDRLLKRL